MNAFEVGVALTPDEFGCVERGDNVEEDDCPTLDCLQHEVGDGPDIHSFDPSRVMPVVQGHPGHQNEKHPEGNIANGIAHAHAAEGKVLRNRGACAEELLHKWNSCNGSASHWLQLFVLLERNAGALAAGAGCERLERHGKNLHRSPRVRKPMPIQRIRL